MTFARTATTAAVCASLLAGNLAFTSTSAEARDWRRDRGYHAYNDHGPRDYRPSRRHYDHARNYNYAPPVHERRRNNKAKKIATGVAIGIGALILGSIIADSARRR